MLTEKIHKLSENISQWIWHATYAHSFIALPPQIFAARRNPGFIIVHVYSNLKQDTVYQIELQ
jgi:hypothetical protein